MTQVEFLLNQRSYCERLLAVPADQLPGTMTHDKLMKLATETELELIDHERYTATGVMSYA